MVTVTHLVDFLLGVVQKGWEMLQSAVVEDRLSLVVSAGYNVAHSSQGCRLHLHFPVGEQGHQLGHDAAVYHHLDLLVAPVSEVGESPDCVNQNVDV